MTAACLFTAACSDDPQAPVDAESPCVDGERNVVFVLDGRDIVSKCAVLDTVTASGAPGCTLVVFDVVEERLGDGFFQYEGGSEDLGDPCGSRAFFGIARHPQGRYYFDGLTRRPFGSGTGPFAAGSFEVITDASQLIDAGTFEFWEGRGP